MEVLVIGAGVNGPSCAIRLAEAGHAVRIRAAAPPGETTSRVAGAMWGSTFAGPADRVGGWAAESLAVFRRLASDPDTGVAMATGTLGSRTGAAPPPELFPGVDIRPIDPPYGLRAAFEPPLRDARVLEHQVGLRPARAAVRVEADGRVVHDYGHGGTGVGLSWGCAREVVALVEAR